jgi:hypothetical protein
MLFLSRAILALALLLSVCSGAVAGPKTSAGKAGPKAGKMQMSAVALTVMIKDAIIALHQANMTGNYSVLRDMGSPVFRENFDQARLTAVFANLRARRIDLSPAYFLSPNLTQQPKLNKDNELVLRGFFPAQPQRIQFELRFMQLDGKWRLAGIGVDAEPPATGQKTATAKQTPSSKKRTPKK